MTTAWQHRADLIAVRAHIVRALRDWFHRETFVEVDSPVFVTAPAPERFVDAVAVPLRAGMGQPASQRYAQTSPELAMKQMLALGLPRIVQIAAVLRDGDFGPHHRPEFRLVEWYRSAADWQAGMKDCEQLLRLALFAAQAAPLATRPLPAALLAVAQGAPIARMTFAEAAQQFAKLGPGVLHDQAKLQAAMAREGMHTAADDALVDLCHRLWVDRIEPGLAGLQQPVFITHFPRALASFAQLDAGDPHVAERFELYACGLELANGFTELTCEATYRARFAEERAHRLAAGKAVYPEPIAFFSAVPDMPPAVGVAMGLERLLMVALSVQNIDDVAALPYGQT